MNKCAKIKRNTTMICLLIIILGVFLYLYTNKSTDTLLKDVLLGEAEFSYNSDGRMETMQLADAPLLFDANDPSMKIWDFAVVDLDGDGEKEVILSVIGMAGDMGGKLILHLYDGKVYGYTTDNRTLIDLKTDGTYDYSDPTGVNEGGIASITDFSDTGYTIDKMAYWTGTYEGWDTFMVEHQPATEEEYVNVTIQQANKQNATWYEYNSENSNAVLNNMAILTLQ